ncbi:hypothetical protein Aasi_1727 [Candidatus Amoebophilus asiaticus 5a2]|uniref:Uncharacterized protein n=1 Tax=Amoebophilus asiaticus (strain 5a2) TaxID=452471 RepID=C3L3W8_AMOA5|nr:hypothetical protein Aasi_1727 [Candidatus Amoebophilus asiaticus 5a2]
MPEEHQQERERRQANGICKGFRGPGRPLHIWFVEQSVRRVNTLFPAFLYAILVAIHELFGFILSIN